MFRYKQRDKEDYVLSKEDVEVYAKAAKASYAAVMRLDKLGVAAKGAEKLQALYEYLRPAKAKRK